MKLSAVIITFNEERNIERCLKSVRNIADEIVVLDSFSTDKTEEICKKYNVNFLQHKFDGHIQQKNRAAEYAKNDFVLSLDADEFLSDELKESIQEIKKNPEFDAYKFNRLNIYCGKPIRHTSWYPDRKIRLWNRKKGKWGGINPHDTVILQAEASLKLIKGDLVHYSYNSIEEHIAQTNKFTTIAAKELFEKGKKSNGSIIFIKTIGSFVKEFILKLAFLDGFYGITVGYINTFSVFLKYSKLKTLIKDSEK